MKEKELSLNEIKDISKGFKHIKLLSITGGEPSLRDDLPEIVHIFCKNNGRRVGVPLVPRYSEKARGVVISPARPIIKYK